MSLLSNSICEEIDITITKSPVGPGGNNQIKGKGKGHASKVKEKNKIIAACTGAVLTSLTSESHFPAFDAIFFLLVFRRGGGGGARTDPS